MPSTCFCSSCCLPACSASCCSAIAWASASNPRPRRFRVFYGAFFVNIIYVLATVIAVVLAGYLCVALLKPEWFE